MNEKKISSFVERKIDEKIFFGYEKRKSDEDKN